MRQKWGVCTREGSNPEAAPEEGIRLGSRLASDRFQSHERSEVRELCQFKDVFPVSSK